MTSATTVGVLGLGEAGGAIAADLLAAGAVVRAYDPAVAAPAGAVQAGDEADAASGADVVLSVNSSHDAEAALTVGRKGLGHGAVWAELNSSSAGAKRHLASLIDPGPGVFADVAIMGTVPGNGIRTPMLTSGPGAARFVELMVPLGCAVRRIEGPVGEAATRKLLRSVFFKGMSAAVVEARLAARQVGLEDWLAAHVTEVLAGADETLADRIVDGTFRHARRRADEMEAAGELLSDLGVEPRVARASEAWLRAIVAGDLPTPPSG